MGSWFMGDASHKFEPCRPETITPGSGVPGIRHWNRLTEQSQFRNQTVAILRTYPRYLRMYGKDLDEVVNPKPADPTAN